jgi:hypothetical protein
LGAVAARHGAAQAEEVKGEQPERKGRKDGKAKDAKSFGLESFAPFAESSRPLRSVFAGDACRTRATPFVAWR